MLFRSCCSVTATTASIPCWPRTFPWTIRSKVRLDRSRPLEREAPHSRASRDLAVPELIAIAKSVNLEPTIKWMEKHLFARE